MLSGEGPFAGCQKFADTTNQRLKIQYAATCLTTDDDRPSAVDSEILVIRSADESLNGTKNIRAQARSDASQFLTLGRALTIRLALMLGNMTASPSLP
jgi:hypothetical protein